MLSSSTIHRLKEKEIEKLLEKGRTYRGKFLTLKIRKNNLPFSQWAFIVPSRLSKRAVVRNRLRRRLKENFRSKIKAIKPGFDGVILSRLPALDKTYQELNREIDKLLMISNLKFSNSD